MKKLIALLLIIVMLLPTVSPAEDSDQIVGSWYMMITVKGSLFESSFPDNALRVITILTFTEDGNILFAEQDYYNDGNVDAPQPTIYGKWEKDGSKYNVSIIAVGKDEAFIEDGLLYLAAFSGGLYFGFRKLEEFDPYYEVYRK